MINANSSEAIRVELTGYDIPGAYLLAFFEDHAVSAFKMWLFCRGIIVSSSWKIGVSEVLAFL